MRLPTPYRDEAEVVSRLLPCVSEALDWDAVVATASSWVRAAPIASTKGLALTRLADALQLWHGLGETVGAALVAARGIRRCRVHRVERRRSRRIT